MLSPARNPSPPSTTLDRHHSRSRRQHHRRPPSRSPDDQQPCEPLPKKPDLEQRICRDRARQHTQPPHLQRAALPSTSVSLRRSPVAAMGPPAEVAAAPREPDLAPKLPGTAAAGSPDDHPPRLCTVRAAAPCHRWTHANPRRRNATAGRTRIPTSRTRPTPPRLHERKGKIVPAGAGAARALPGDTLRRRRGRRSLSGGGVGGG